MKYEHPRVGLAILYLLVKNKNIFLPIKTMATSSFSFFAHCSDTFEEFLRQVK